jgi:hypothetical protein
MTWSAVHTIPYSTTADWHTGFTYLFGTFLPSLTGMAAGNHPDASTFKKKFSRTSLNLYTGASYTEYFWITWGSATAPANLNMYRDGTYTSVPGDLCTDTTNLVSASLPVAAGNIRFWTSSVNPRAGLMTKGKAVIWWEPGFSAAAHYEFPGWVGTAATCMRSHIFPYTPTNIPWRCGPPDVSTGTSTVENYWGPSPGVPATGLNYTIQTRIDMGCTFMGYQSSGVATPNTGTELLFGSVGNDIGFYRAAPCSTTNRNVASSTVGQVALCSGRYYLMGVGGTGGTSLVWDMGTSEPDMS